MASYRLFISAVSGELGSYREEIARALRRKGLEVSDQRHFRQGSATLLEQLRDYIRDCDAVILLIGHRCGSLPESEHAATIGGIAEFEKFRQSTRQSQASFSQWEFFLAKHFGKPTYTFLTDDRFTPDSTGGEAPDLELLQQAYREWILHTGEHYDPLTTVQKLIEDVLVLPFPDLARPKPIALPYPSLGALFQGREESLRELEAGFSRHAARRASAIVCQAVHGLGGVGKTRLAVEYAWQHTADYSGLIFVTADSPANLQRNLAALVGPLVLNLPEESAPEEEVKVAAVLRWLHDHPDWFLILDNVDAEAAAIASEELLSRLTSGHVMITSRLARWNGAIEPLQLDVLAPESAVRLLLDRTGRDRRKRPTDDGDALQIARELDGLALALEQAGAYIAHRRISLSDYLAAWKSHSAPVQGWHDPRTMKYPRSVAVTWQTTFDQLHAPELALLRLFAWLAPDPIPLFIIDGDKALAPWREAVAIVSVPDSGTTSPAAIDSDPDVYSALSTLADFSLIRWDSTAETVSIHRVVQEILRNQTPGAQPTAMLTCCLRWMEAVIPDNPRDVRTWAKWNALRPHVAALVAHGERAGILQPTWWLMNELGRLLMEQANFGEAEPLLRSALAVGEKQYGAAHSNVAVAAHSLATLLRRTNQPQEAEALMNRALTINEQALGPTHPRIADNLTNLALLLQRTNRLTQAEKLMQRALALNEQAHGLNDHRVATSLRNLASILKETNRFTEAESLMRRALTIYEHAYDADHTGIAAALHDLASLLKGMNRMSEAEPLMRRALAVNEQAYGPDHPYVATNIGNLASLLQRTNRAAEAEPLKRRALAINERAYGPGHPKVANSLGRLASLLKATNRLAEAEPLNRRALEIDERAFGPMHPEVAIDLASLASLLSETNRVAEAEGLMARAVQIFDDFSERTGHKHYYDELTRDKYKLLLKVLNFSDSQIGERLNQIAH